MYNLINYLELNNQYVINNSTNLAHDIDKLNINKNHRFITYNIKDLFVNIPIQEKIKCTFVGIRRYTIKMYGAGNIKLAILSVSASKQYIKLSCI